MNHTFIDKGDMTCAKCSRSIVEHGPDAQCECCPNIGDCEVIDNMLMCASCQARDKEIKAELGEPTGDPSLDKVSLLVNRLGKEIPTDRRAYFVSEVTAIVDIEKQFLDEGMDSESARYQTALTVESNLAKWKQIISAALETVREGQGSVVADQKYLNHIVPQLRAEEREKFKAYDITYQPSAVVKSTVAKPRMSASDKAMESMAKMLGISIEQARISMANAVKNVTGNQCTCAETPGLCKIHPK